MNYDDASWHDGGDHRQVDSPDELEHLRARKLTPVPDRRLANWRRGRTGVD